MTFAIDSNPTPTQLSEAVNYLLANFGANLAADPNTGQISGPSGIVIAYLYKYIAVKYADSFDGSDGFSDSPTNKEYYGINNSNTDVESTNPADYIWYKVAGGGFGTTKFLFYQVAGGRQINFVVDTAAPDASYIQADTTAIDLDIITVSTGFQSALPTIYQWTSSSTAPARPSTTTTYYWNTGVYTAPVSWSTAIAENTTPGSYLWAISIPLTVPTTTETSELDWTNTSYPIFTLAYNGENGTPGDPGENGLSAITAYLVQSQSASAPSGFPQTTSGSTLPSGWSASAPSVSVGQVLWFTQGKYNSSSTTIGGVSPNTTYWAAPVAASIFQDIRSDNWNGSTPPVYGTTASYGSAGYYIQRSTGDVYFNNGVFRADIQTDGDAKFEGKTTTTVQIDVYGTSYNIDYSAFGYAGTNASSSSIVRAGVYGYSSASTSAFNIGLIGNAPSSTKGYGVYGAGGEAGGLFYGSSSGSVGLQAQAYSASDLGFAFNGKLQWTNTSTSISYIWPEPNGDGRFLRNDGTWASPSSAGMTTAGTNSGTATVSSSTVNFLGSTSTGIAGAYVGTSGSGNTVTFTVQTTSPSDSRLKEEIQDVDVGLDFVKQLRPVSYKLKADPRHQKGYGFIADDVEKLGVYGSSLVYEEPNWQVGDEIGFKTIHYPSYIAVLTKAIQELTSKVEALEAKYG